MAYHEGNNIYSFTSPENATDFSIIFNNGNPSTNKKQTDDLRVTESACVHAGDSRINGGRLIFTPVVKNKCDFFSSIESVIDNSISIYPNPTTGILYLSDSDKINAVYLSTLTGSIFPVVISNGVIDITEFSPGIYMLQAIKNDNTSAWIKIIKQ